MRPCNVWVMLRGGSGFGMIPQLIALQTLVLQFTPSDGVPFQKRLRCVPVSDFLGMFIVA
jgi:hypothetical protein